MTGKHRIQGRDRAPLNLFGDEKQPAPYTVTRSTAAGSLSRQPEPSWLAVLSTTLRLWRERRSAMRRESGLTRQMIGMALLIAGPRREYLRDAWRADLYADDGRRLSVWRQLRHITGYLIAAINYRFINDLGGALSRLLDKILMSRAWTRVVVACLYAVPVVMILFNQGAYGLVENAGTLAVVAGGLAAGLRWLRRRRGVEPPKRDSQSQGK